MPACLAPTAPGVSTDPTLDAVCTRRRAKEQAEVALLVSIADWAAAHTTDGDPDEATFLERPLGVGGIGCPLVEEFAAYDLGAALGMSTESAIALLARAVELRWRLPRVWQAVVAGRLGVWKAGRIADSTMVLPMRGAAYVDHRLGQAVASISYAQVERLVEEALVRFDPDEAERRAEKESERRRATVHLRDLDHTGTVEVSATLDAADGLDLEAALQHGAAELASLGSTETLDVRRSQALGLMARRQLALDLSGEGPATTAGRGVTLFAHLSEDSLDSGVCRFDTAGAPSSVVLIDQVRRWCQSAGTTVVVKPVVDLDDSTPVDAYEIPDRLVEQVGLRDVHCVFPDCRRPARRCDTDHIHPHGAGGLTSSANLAPLCRRHHRAKTHGWWRYTVQRPGAYLWISPSGRRYLRDHRGTHALDEPAEP